MTGEMNSRTEGMSVGPVKYFDPISMPDYDVPFPLVDLVYKNRFELSQVNRR